MNDKSYWAPLFLLFMAVLFWGCMMKPTQLKVQGYDQALGTGDILDATTHQVIDSQQLIEKLSQVQVIYVGESHTNRSHHDIQLLIIQALVDKDLTIGVGLEMFDHTYQPKLNRWTAGDLDWPNFLKQVHWYANWRYSDALYQDILLYVQSQKLRLTGLNVPFHLPPKIATGGLTSLSKPERALLPETIDTSDERHRAYVEKIFKQHKIKGRDDFDNFYAAQCTWEDGMAQAISKNTGDGKMVVLVGNGHIVHKFGVPNRAHKRNGASFRTVYLASPGDEIDIDAADFIWVGEATLRMHGRF